jgi:hypothetical protein
MFLSYDFYASAAAKMPIRVMVGKVESFVGPVAEQNRAPREQRKKNGKWTPQKCTDTVLRHGTSTVQLCESGQSALVHG